MLCDVITTGDETDPTLTPGGNGGNSVHPERLARHRGVCGLV